MRKYRTPAADGMSFRECLPDDGDIFSTAISLFVRKFPPGDLTSRKDVPFAVGIWDSLLTQLKTTFTYCRQYTKVVLFINLLKLSY